MQRDPDNFNTAFEQRGWRLTSSRLCLELTTFCLVDYAAIDLPTFTVSSRDYIRVTGQVDGDGEPTCFSDKVDTGIPAVQDWCRQLTIKSRERTARSFLQHLITFLNSVQSYLHDMSTYVTAFTS